MISLAEHYVISCGTVPSSLLILRDKPAEERQVSLEDYFASTFEILSARLERFADFSHAPDILEEKELIPLLQTLINTKEMLQLKRKSNHRGH